MSLCLALVFALAHPNWRPLPIPWTDCPIKRVHGVGGYRNSWLVGGHQGLYITHDGRKWELVSKEAVRQVIPAGEIQWVVFGNGSVDKVDLKQNRLYFDVFQGALRRPWICSGASNGTKMLFGGQGGWSVKTAQSQSSVFPKELGIQPICAISPFGGAIALGTQDGLYLAKGPELKRFSFAQGLEDTWITGLATSRNDLYVGTASGGFYKLTSRRKIQAIPSPSKRIRHVSSVNGLPIIGTLEGTYLRIPAQGKNEDGWHQLASGECTFIQEVAGSVWIGTAEGKQYSLQRYSPSR